MVNCILELGAALSWTEDRLENLWLDYEGGNATFSHADLSPLSTLSSFKVLKNLRMAMYLFLGIDGDGTTWFGLDGQGPAPNLASLMPSSIETLYFSKSEGRIEVLISALEKLLQAKDSCTPQLRRIASEADVIGKDDAFDYSRLGVLVEEAGVEIAKVDGKGVERGQRKNWSLTVSTLANFLSHSLVLRDVSDMSSDQRKDMLPHEQFSICINVANASNWWTSSTPRGYNISRT